MVSSGLGSVPPFAPAKPPFWVKVMRNAGHVDSCVPLRVITVEAINRSAILAVIGLSLVPPFTPAMPPPVSEIVCMSYHLTFGSVVGFWNRTEEILSKLVNVWNEMIRRVPNLNIPTYIGEKKCSVC